MSKLELKKITFGIIVLSIVAILFSSIPLIAYYINFGGHEASKMPSDWADFGSFISGTSGVILSFFAVVFALTSIYFTAQIAKYIQQNEFEFSRKQSDAQLKLTLAQSKPYPYINLSRLTDRTSIIIQNGGLGPLIIKNITVNYNQNERFENIKKLFDHKLQLQTNNGAQINYDTAPDPIIAPNNSILILEIIPKNTNYGNFKDTQSSCRSILQDCTITLECEDIYKNAFEYSKELSFLGEPPPKPITIDFDEINS